MTIVSLKVNDTHYFFKLPKSIVDEMLLDYDLVEAYFQQAVKLSYFTRYPEGAKASNLHIRKRIPVEIPKEHIFKFGYRKNKKILQSIWKTKKESHPGDVIQKTIGVFGRWHLCVYLLGLLCKFSIAFHQLSIVFISPNISFACSDEAIDSCAPDCPSYTFDKSIFTSTITTQWGLVCQRSRLAQLAQTLSMLGVFLGNLLGGYLSDRFGRKKQLLGDVIIQAVFGVAAAYIPWLWLFLIMRFLTAAAVGGMMVSSYVLVMESIGWKRRSVAGVLYQLPTGLAHALVACISYFLRDWKLLQQAVSLPSLLLVFLYWRLPESPRWLLRLGKREEAVKVLAKAAKRNGLPTEDIGSAVEGYTPKSSSEGMKELLRSSTIRKNTLALCYTWLVVGFFMFVLSQHVSELDLNVFLAVGLAGVLQVPGLVFSLWCVQAWGRKWSLVLANGTVAVASLFLTVTSSSVPYDCAFSSLGLFGAMVAFCTLGIYSVELFPTSWRCLGVGVSMACARVGAILGPLVVGFNELRLFLPPLIVGVFAMGAVGVCFLLPETLDCDLPETVEDVEGFEKNKQY